MAHYLAARLNNWVEEVLEVVDRLLVADVAPDERTRIPASLLLSVAERCGVVRGTVGVGPSQAREWVGAHMTPVLMARARVHLAGPVETLLSYCARQPPVTISKRQ